MMLESNLTKMRSVEIAALMSYPGKCSLRET